jgi:hypothetical protein
MPYRKYIMNDDISEKLFVNINEKNHQVIINNNKLDEIITSIEKNIFSYNLLINKYKYIKI